MPLVARVPRAEHAFVIQNERRTAGPKEPTMNRRLSDRLASLTLACAVTLALAGGIHGLAASEAAATAAQLAHSAGTPLCARV